MLGTRAVAASIALAAGAAGIFLAAHHPSPPGLALTVFILWCAAAIRNRRLWLVVLPACLPATDFSPWTGWIAFDEFDLVVLGAIAAGNVRIAGSQGDRTPAEVPSNPQLLPHRGLALALLCVASTALASFRGVTADGSPAFGWYDGYADPLNALRVGKSVIYAVLLWPVLRQEWRRSEADAARCVATGMLVGAAVVVIAVLWERAAYPGLLDFSEPYRTVALFWEMNFGGAAIDSYLAMAASFVAWAVAQARTPIRYGVAAVLAVLFEYACLTTFSRGVYFAVFGSLVVLAILLARRGPRPDSPRWRRNAKVALIIVMLLQGVAVIGNDSFMLARMKRSTHDFGSRLAHWNNGLHLLRGPTDWWLGKGLGRLPAEYAATVPQGEFSGDAKIVSASAQSYLRLSGPRRSAALAGLYALTQRVSIEPIAYQAAFDIRTDTAMRLGVSLCEVHLLYESECRRATARVLPGGARWQRLTLSLEGPSLPSRTWPPRSTVFAITLLDSNTVADLDNIALSGGGGANLLRNGDFSSRLSHWFPVAKDYFVPWHIDNLALELLIEQGIVGLTTFVLLLGYALASLLSRQGRESRLAPFLAASLTGALLVGLVSSIVDVPRVAFLLFFLSFLSIQLGEPRVCLDPR